jgi:hypothetical protein
MDDSVSASPTSKDEMTDMDRELAARSLHRFAESCQPGGPIAAPPSVTERLGPCTAFDRPICDSVARNQLPPKQPVPRGQHEGATRWTCRPLAPAI